MHAATQLLGTGHQAGPVNNKTRYDPSRNTKPVTFRDGLPLPLANVNSDETLQPEDCAPHEYLSRKSPAKNSWPLPLPVNRKGKQITVSNFAPRVWL